MSRKRSHSSSSCDSTSSSSSNSDKSDTKHVNSKQNKRCCKNEKNSDYIYEKALTLKQKLKKKERSSSSSSSTSEDSDYKRRKKEKKQRRKDKKRLRKLKKKEKKIKRLVKKSKAKSVQTPPASHKSIVPTGPVPGPPIPELSDRALSMKPMTKEEWDKRQQVIRKVYDEETGRHRLIKGDGEILEEIVSRDRHRDINRQATQGDGAFFQAQVANKLSQ